MARLKRLYYSSAVYHVCIRGNNRQPVLGQAEDKIAFLETLSKFKERFVFKLFGLVLMDNHPHIVIQVNAQTNISKIMQAVALSYSHKFRRKYSYSGYVWQGRFKSNVVDTDIYLLKCLDYIHNNPVRAKIVDKPEDYFWSSYNYYARGINQLSDYIEIDKFCP